MNTTTTQSGNGSATAGGMAFQHRVAAWVAVHILAEKAATPPWDLAANTTIEFLGCEFNHPVDDLIVSSSAPCHVFAQVKRSLVLSKSAGSDLASTLHQFVRQFFASRGGDSNEPSADRSLSINSDRLVLITSSKSSLPVRSLLPAVLRRYRELGKDWPLEKAAVNNEEQRVVSVLKTHVTRSWKQVTGLDPSDHDLGSLLSLIHVHVLDVDEGQAGEREAITLLRTAVLVDPDDAKVAWVQLIDFCTNLAASRSGAGRAALRDSLLKSSVPLVASKSYLEDIERLKTVHRNDFRCSLSLWRESD